MRRTDHVAILGQGHAVPDVIRGNDAPVYDWIRTHMPPGTDLFNGLRYRRVLPRADGVIEIMKEACRQAMHQSGCQPEDIDMILGAGSVSSDIAPNDLAVVHHELRLPDRCRIMPINTDYSAFEDGVRLANDLISCDTIRHALVVCGNNWTHHMDYHEPVSLAASDGAGAVVMGRTQDTHCFRLIDWDNETQSRWYGAFRMAPRSIGHHGYTKPLMTLDARTGNLAIETFGLHMPGVVVNRLLARHGLTGADITLIPHQTSLTVQQAWQAAIQPACYISTLEEFGDMVSSSVPVNFAHCQAQIRTRHVVMLGIGMEMHCTALLMARD